MTPDELAALRSPAGAALLAEIGEYRADDVLATTARLRAAGHPADLIAAGLTQARLRGRAVERLGPAAAGWWFTADGAEQATRPAVAQRRAERLAASGVTVVADLGCGIGADTLAFARAGLRVLAVDRDPLTAAVAAANVADAGFSAVVDVRCADAAEVDLAGVDAVYLDPARRAGGRRISAPQQWSPPWSAVLAHAAARPTLAKVAPGIDHDLPPGDAETEWVSVGGQLVEACVWFAPLARTARRAVLLPSGREFTAEGMGPAAVGRLGAWIVEPDDAVIRAGLVARIAEELTGRLLDPRIAYVTTDVAPPPDAAYRAFSVVESLPFSVKRLRDRVRALGVGQVTVKKRGVAVDPDDLRRQLRLDPAASGDLTVLLTRVGDAPLAILARPL